MIKLRFVLRVFLPQWLSIDIPQWYQSVVYCHGSTDLQSIFRYVIIFKQKSTEKLICELIVICCNVSTLPIIQFSITLVI